MNREVPRAQELVLVVIVQGFAPWARVASAICFVDRMEAEKSYLANGRHAWPFLFLFPMYDCHLCYNGVLNSNNHNIEVMIIASLLLSYITDREAN
jgi:hypothetical protein